MKKFSVVAIGIVFLLAGLCSPVFADSGHGSSPAQAGSAKMDSNSDLTMVFGDHILEIFTALASDNGYADKYFYPGETIYFIGEIYLTFPGPIAVYTILTDAGGKVLLTDEYVFTAENSYTRFWYSADFLTTGIYNFSVLISTAYGLLLSPTAFTLVVL